MRLAVIAAVLVIPVATFAQREHFELFALLPLLGAATLRCNGLKPPSWASVSAGIGAAIAVAIKPHAGLCHARRHRARNVATEIVAPVICHRERRRAAACRHLWGGHCPRLSGVFQHHAADRHRRLCAGARRHRRRLVFQPQMLVVVVLCAAAIPLCRDTPARSPAASAARRHHRLRSSLSGAGARAGPTNCCPAPFSRRWRWQSCSWGRRTGRLAPAG